MNAKSDNAKLETLVRECLSRSLGKRMIFASLTDLYNAGQFSNVRKRNLAEEIGDQLCCSALIREFGVWVFAEYGDGQMVFVHLGEPPTVDRTNENHPDFIQQSIAAGLAVSLNKILRRV